MDEGRRPVIFNWPTRQQVPIPAENQVEQVELVSTSDEDERVMYTGARRTAQQVARVSGSVSEIRKGMLVVVPADNDETNKPFWLAKVVDITRQDGIPTKLKVHWMRTSSDNAFQGRYDMEMIKVGQGKRAKNTKRIGLIDLSEVKVLAYDFTLTANNKLREVTKKLLRSACGLEDTSKSKATDDDEVSLVDSDEEDRSSTSTFDSEAEDTAASGDHGVNESDDEMHPDIAARCKHVR